jgi:hypothetical protein
MTKAPVTGRSTSSPRARRQPAAAVTSPTPTRPTTPPANSPATYSPIALPPSPGVKTSATYGTPTISRPGMHIPWSVRKRRNSSKLGARATPSVGTASRALARVSERLRP